MSVSILDRIIPHDSKVQNILNIDFLRTCHCTHSQKFQIEQDILRQCQSSGNILTSSVTGGSSLTKHSIKKNTFSFRENWS